MKWSIVRVEELLSTNECVIIVEEESGIVVHEHARINYFDDTFILFEVPDRPYLMIVPWDKIYSINVVGY